MSPDRPCREFRAGLQVTSSIPIPRNARAWLAHAKTVRTSDAPVALRDCLISTFRTAGRDLSWGRSHIRGLTGNMHSSREHALPWPTLASSSWRSTWLAITWTVWSLEDCVGPTRGQSRHTRTVLAWPHPSLVLQSDLSWPDQDHPPTAPPVAVATSGEVVCVERHRNATTSVRVSAQRGAPPHLPIRYRTDSSHSNSPSGALSMRRPRRST